MQLIERCCLRFHFWYSSDLRTDVKRKKTRQAIKRSAIFEKHADSKETLAKHLAGLANRKKNIVTNIKSDYFESKTANVVIGRKKGTETDRLSSRNSDDVLDSRMIRGITSDSRDYETNSIESNEETRKAMAVETVSLTKGLDSTNQLSVIHTANVGTQMGVKSPVSIQDQSLVKRQEDGANEVILKEAKESSRDVISSCKAPEELNSKGIVIANSNNPLVAEYGGSSDESEENVNIG